MGQRTTTETLFGIISAFIHTPTWKQADLARELETSPATIRKKLVELQAAGFKLTTENDHPHVYWSVPKNWFPGALLFKAEEIDDLLRVLARARSSKERDRVLAVATSRLAGLGQKAPPAFRGEVRPEPADTSSEEFLSVIEDSARKQTALKMKYFSASRRGQSVRHVSVQRVDLGVHAQMIAWCHKNKELRRFRVSNVSSARLDASEPFHDVTPKALETFDEESFGAYREDGPKIACVFTVRNPEAAWVAHNLPDRQITTEDIADGKRFAIETSSVFALARFVTSLGAAAKPETPELARDVAAIAEGALTNARGR